ncbi:MAG: Peptidase M1 membrane alanine aminopeptidase [Ignavibacteria bacterium]|nr:MAG: Peptidase M1 membrane alanine aminopeptidase [Ignavibacteria bacterium]KAF0161339.1 MAG: Peptidase M1 membrane alanine aminopeptidase [Ignavibacteria bacterium]
MKQKNVIYLFLSFLICTLIVGSYSIYYIIQNSFALGLSNAYSAGLALKEFNAEKLAKYNPSTQRALDVIHYLLKIDLDTQKKKISGDVTITMNINDPNAKLIPINFYDNMVVKSVQINGVEARFSRETKILSIQKNSIEQDSVKVRIIYSGTPKSLGFGSFNFETHQNHPFVYTLNEPVFASTWFPCVDLPDDKAQADIYITNDSCCVSISNGRLISIKDVGIKKTYHWKTIYPISTYLIAIYSGKYKSFSQKYVSVTKDTLNLTYYAFESNLENARKDFSDHPEYFKVFEEIFGEYPFVKEKYSVAEFLWQYGAMEHQTITGIGSNFVGGNKFFTDVLVHELAHHWWGNAVGPKTWKDIWLNEGFATYSEALYWEVIAGHKALQTTINAKFGTFNDGKLYDPGDALFGTLIYNKGAWVLHMLRKEIGDEKFFLALKEYLKLYKYSNASTNDFKKVCEKVSGIKLNQFFNQWVYNGEGIIELAYDWSFEEANSEFSFVLNTEQLQNGYDIYKFPVEVKIIYDENESETKILRIENRRQRFNFILKKKPKNVLFDPDKWLLATFESRND